MAASHAITSATTVLYVSTSGATADAAAAAAGTSSAYNALTWQAVSEVSNLGTLGGKVTIVKHIPVDTATVVKRAGSVDYGTMAVTMAKHTGSDFTQLQTSFNGRLSTAFKLVYPAALGSTDAFTAVISDLQSNVSTADSILMQTCTLEIDSPIISY